MAYSYENELNALKEAQRKSAVADLENTRNQALSNLQAEQQKNLANYNTQRNTANVQNQLNSKNFQEYLASTGRANSGLASQAKLQNDNNLQTSLNSINSAQNASNADIYRRQTDANNAYNTGLASANANIEANYIQNLLDQRAKAAQLEQQEREFNESVRQFNEQMAYNYANLRGGSSGSSSGGGSRRSSKKSSGSSNSEISWTDTSNENTNGKTSKQNNKTSANGGNNAFGSGGSMGSRSSSTTNKKKETKKNSFNLLNFLNIL
jgi:hypothetical protein